MYYSRVGESPESTSIGIHLLWVDPNDNSDIIKTLQNEEVVVTQFPDSTSLRAFLLKQLPSLGHGEDRNLKLSHLKIASNRFRGDDGEEAGGVRLLQWLRQPGSEWISIPFILFCGNANFVKHEMPSGEGISLTDNPTDFVKLVTKKPKKTK